MKSNSFFENFELLAESPNGIQKLREMILQLAVQGKLVEQDPNDEAASFLVDQIKAERVKLIKEKKVKEDKNLVDINEDEIPIDLPKGWVIERFGKIIYVVRGASPRPKGDPRYFSKERTPFHWIKISDIRKYADGWVLKDTDEFLTEEGAKKSLYLEKGTFVLSNSATIGVPTILGINGCIHDGYLAFPHLNENHLSIKYLYYFFLYFQGELKKRAFGGAQLNLNTGIVKNIAFPLPPFEEQKRIVTKVDQLMALCDQLDSLQQKKNESRIQLNDSALRKMLNAGSPEEFAEHWQLVCKNFDLLYDDLDNVEKLKQAILQLAVQGKLVEQDPNNEPAAVLLENIWAEKKRLLKEEKIKKPNVLIKDVEFPYDIPISWEWVRLSDVVYNFGQKKPNVEFTYIDVASINKEMGVISNDVQTLTPEKAPSRARKIVKKGCVIYSTVRPYLLNIALVDKDFNPEPIVSTAFAVLNPYSGLYNKYLYYYLRSPPFTAYVESKMLGMAYPAINDSKLYRGLVPLPPIEEQKRIVEKVDVLINLCNQLEEKIINGQKNAETLMDAFLTEAVRDLNEI